MNCLLLEQGADRVIVDCGVAFPSEDQGVDVYRPRFDCLSQGSATLRAVVLTHGHEDHIGALPTLLERFAVPVWGPPYALELARRRLAEQGLGARSLELRTIAPGRDFTVGSFGFEPVRVAHSIAQTIALAIDTAAGLVVHSGDFRLVGTDAEDAHTDLARLGELGRRGVRLLLSDSTNIDDDAEPGDEDVVAQAIDRIVGAASARVVVGVFASNVHRLRSIGEICLRRGRRLCLLGRSVHNHAEVARGLGLLHWPSDLVLPAELARDRPPRELLYVASGTQAEPRGALRLLAAGEHPQLRLEPGDVVVLSSRNIPGNERAVQQMVDACWRLGAEVHTRATRPELHTSGHAHRTELGELIELLAPRTFVPVHGTRHQLERHAALARERGVPEVEVLDNGEPVELALEGRLRRLEPWPAEPVAMSARREVGDEVLRERRRLGRSGLIALSVMLVGDGRARRVVRAVAVGVPDAHELEVALERAVARVVESALADGPELSELSLRDTVERAARGVLRGRLSERPVIVVQLTHATAGA